MSVSSVEWTRLVFLLSMNFLEWISLHIPWINTQMNEINAFFFNPIFYFWILFFFVLRFFFQLVNRKPIDLFYWICISMNESGCVKLLKKFLVWYFTNHYDHVINFEKRIIVPYPILIKMIDEKHKHCASWAHKQKTSIFTFVLSAPPKWIPTWFLRIENRKEIQNCII